MVYWQQAASGEISIGLRRLGPGELLLEVADNGIGLPAGLDWQRAKSTGLATTEAIARHQLQGALTITSDGGVRCQVRFRDDLYSERV